MFSVGMSSHTAKLMVDMSVAAESCDAQTILDEKVGDNENLPSVATTTTTVASAAAAAAVATIIAVGVATTAATAAAGAVTSAVRHRDVERLLWT